MANNNKSRLSISNANFNSLMTNGFGVVTVMNVKVYDAIDFTSSTSDKKMTIDEIKEKLNAATPLCTLETLKISNITMEGPSKTITGGQYNNTLIKFGKTARLEMQDALGTAESLDALCGTVTEYVDDNTSKEYKVMHAGSDFSGIKTIVGDSFFIDKASGEQVKVKIIFYQFNPDSVLNLTQEADGDATVFDLNGDLLMTDISIPTKENTEQSQSYVTRGVFYSIVEAE